MRWEGGRRGGKERKFDHLPAIPCVLLTVDASRVKSKERSSVPLRIISSHITDSPVSHKYGTI